MTKTGNNLGNLYHPYHGNISLLYNLIENKNAEQA